MRTSPIRFSRLLSTCSGDVLKKKQVGNQVRRYSLLQFHEIRPEPMPLQRGGTVSCLDCLKLNRGNAYKSHNTCISAANRRLGDMCGGCTQEPNSAQVGELLASQSSFWGEGCK